MGSILWCQLRFPHGNNVQVRLCFQLFVGGRMSCLRYVCLFAYGGVQSMLCCFCSSCVPCVASFSGLSFFLTQFANVYLWITIVHAIAEGVKAICVVNFVLGLSVLYSLLAIGKLINDTFTAYIKVQVSMCLCRAKSNRHWSNTNRAVDTPY